MLSPGLLGVVSALALGPGALLLGLIATFVVALYGASRAAEHRPDQRAAIWVGAFVGIFLLNAILAFGGCMVAFGILNL
jgi:hypothetical protein